MEILCLTKLEKIYKGKTKIEKETKEDFHDNGKIKKIQGSLKRHR